MAFPPIQSITVTGTDVDNQIGELGHRLWQNRRSAAYRLEKFGDARAVPALIEAATDSNYFVRLAVVRALGKLGDEAAVEPLINALADPDRMVRITALWALGELGHKAKAALPALEPFLTDSTVLAERENTVKEIAELVRTLIELEPEPEQKPASGGLTKDQRKLKRELAMARKKAREEGGDEDAAEKEVLARWGVSSVEELGADDGGAAPADAAPAAAREVPKLEDLPDLPPLESVLPLTPEDRRKRRDLALKIRAAKRHAG